MDSCIRVLQVIGAMDRGGAETVVMNLYRAIDRSKVQFDFLVHEQRECDYDAEIRSLGGCIYRLPRYTIVNGVQYASLCRKHFEEHPEHRVVHGHIGSCSGVYLAQAQRAGRATILHAHSQSFDAFPVNVLFDMLMKRGVRHADLFLACSDEAGRDRFGESVVSGDRYRIMRNGVDVAKYRCNEDGHRAARDALGMGPGLAVVHVGRFVEVKNHRFLLQVFACILQQRPDAMLYLLGRGPLEDKVRMQVQEMGVADHVVFCGVRDDVESYLKASDLFVFPSVSEGLPLAVVEAQASGTCCLVSTGVPASAVVSRAARHLDLSSGPENWAQQAFQLLGQGFARQDGAVDVAAAGYDINQTAAWLGDVYLGLEKGIAPDELLRSVTGTCG